MFSGQTYCSSSPLAVWRCFTLCTQHGPGHTSPFTRWRRRASGVKVQIHEPSLRPWHGIWCNIFHPHPICMWYQTARRLFQSAPNQTKQPLSLPISINLHNNNISAAAPKHTQTDLITSSPSFAVVFLFFLSLPQSQQAKGRADFRSLSRDVNT